MDARALHHRARTSGVNPFVYWPVRFVLIPFFRVYFRLGRVGREHVPGSGPLLLAANHRSFLDPFVLGTMLGRPVYYVAKRELFRNPLIGWFLNALGAFPVDRGSGDQDMLTTAKAILARGDVVLIFPEGTRVRPGGLGTPRRGVGRLALETGAPVVPLAVIGTEHVRRGWRIRPHRVTIRAGRPLTFPRVEQPTQRLAQAVTDRIWPCVALQWEWLGGLAPLRRATVIGAGARGTSVATTLRDAGLEVQLGTRTKEQAERLHLDGITTGRTAELDLTTADLVVLAVPSRSLPHVLAAHGERIPERAGVLTLSRGLVAPLGVLPSAFAAERVPARAIACLAGDATRVIASSDRSFAAQLVQTFAAAGVAARRTDDVLGVELAGVATVAAAFAASSARGTDSAAAGAATGEVWRELTAYARRAGARPETLAIGDLVAAVGAQPAAGTLGQAVDVIDTLPLLVERLRHEGADRAAVEALAALVAGETTADEWLQTVTRPAGRPHAAAA